MAVQGGVSCLLRLPKAAQGRPINKFKYLTNSQLHRNFNTSLGVTGNMQLATGECSTLQVQHVVAHLWLYFIPFSLCFPHCTLLCLLQELPSELGFSCLSSLLSSSLFLSLSIPFATSFSFIAAELSISRRQTLWGSWAHEQSCLCCMKLSL